MSLKITVEINGQTERQLTPLIGQIAAHSRQWLAVETSEKATTEVTVAASSNALRVAEQDRAALLQQHIQQLTAQNHRLQAQLAGTPAMKALPQAVTSAQEIATTASASAPVAQPSPTSEPPALPVQYQMRRRHALAWRLGRRLLWLLPKRERLLLFLLMCGCSYGLLAVMPRLIKQLGSTPEFVESADSGPGNSATPDGNATDEQSAGVSPAANSQPAPANSKAGSHPPPPPAFQPP